MGGGFVLLPVLIVVYPNIGHEKLAAITMTVVLFNSLSGVLSYSRLNRIDYKSGLLFTSITVPTSILGSWLTPFIPVTAFKLLLGFVMLFVAILLNINTLNKGQIAENTNRFSLQRRYCDIDGKEVCWEFDIRKGMMFSGGAGFISSLLGIGGGIFHVPSMVRLLGFPIAVATATSQFIVLFMSVSGTTTHLLSGSLEGEWIKALLISTGAIPGAIIGAKLSITLKKTWILRIFSVIMAGVAIKTILSVF